MNIAVQTDLFFAGKPESWTLFEAFKEAMFSAWPNTQLRVMKTCISFDDPKPYCYVSYPPRKTMKGILVTFGLRERREHPRFFEVTPISKNRFTVHVFVSAADEIDEQLIGFIKEAHDR